MATQLEAVFENGVFRPLEPVHLAEHVRVRVTIEESSTALLAEEHVRLSIPADRWQAFCDALEAPPRNIAALRKLLTEPSVLDDQRPAAY